jgi:hypothetical protein
MYSNSKTMYGTYNLAKQPISHVEVMGQFGLSIAKEDPSLTKTLDIMF